MQNAAQTTPQKTKLTRKEYEDELLKLQIELCKLQEWVRHKGLLEATDTEHAPWHIVRSDDKRRARLNLIAHFLSLIPYEEVPREKVELPKRSKKRRLMTTSPRSRIVTHLCMRFGTIFSLTFLFARTTRNGLKEVNQVASKHFDGAIKLSLLFGQIRRAHF
jgi:hypothetical protein